MPQLDDDVRFETASALAEMMANQEGSQQQQQAGNGPVAAKQVLAAAIEMSRSNPYWNCRLLLQLTVRNQLFYFYIFMFPRQCVFISRQ